MLFIPDSNSFLEVKGESADSAYGLNKKNTVKGDSICQHISLWYRNYFEEQQRRSSKNTVFGKGNLHL